MAIRQARWHRSGWPSILIPLPAQVRRPAWAAAASDLAYAAADGAGIAAQERALLVRKEGDARWTTVTVSSTLSIFELQQAIYKKVSSLTEHPSSLALHRFDPTTMEIGKDVLDARVTVDEAVPQDHRVVVRIIDPARSSGAQVALRCC